jgi:hypothetical protein
MAWKSGGGNGVGNGAVDQLRVCRRFPDDGEALTCALQVTPLPRALALAVSAACEGIVGTHASTATNSLRKVGLCSLRASPRDSLENSKKKESKILQNEATKPNRISKSTPK